MDKLKIRSLVVEHRQRLQAGYCFIGFNSSLDKHKTKVSLKTTEFTIKIDDEEYTVNTKAFFEMNMNSFHGLVGKDTFISFRFITASPKQFDAELLKVDDTACKFQRINLSLDGDGGPVQEATIKCSNCESSITKDKTMSVKRVLELPSSNLDVSEWFCHRHGDEKLFDDSQNNDEPPSSTCFDEKTQQFQPRANDIFYGPFCLLINSQVLNVACFREKRKQLYCKRCLQLVGVNNGSSIKFWCDSVKFNDRLLFSAASSIDLIKVVIRNHLASEAFVSPIVKLIFECTLPSEDKKVHLLIQVMEKNLQLLRLNLENFEFVQQSAVKVMYLKLNNTCEDDKNTLTYWQKEIGVSNYEMSFKMFHAFCEYLQAQSDLIPDYFRSNNGFQLSYIPYC